ncbi:MAG: hypothetical protein WBO68_15305 [Pyrinomonadaceae bacterium]
MYLSKFAKYFLVAAFAMLVAQACKTVSTGEMSNTQLVEASKTEPPYSNKEPEKYQFEIWQTSPTGTEKFFAIRSGEKWRIDSAFGEMNQVTSLHTDKDYVIAFVNKTYAVYGSSHGFDERENMINEITRGMLNNQTKGIFEKQTTDNGITKYKVTSDIDKGKEAIISFDENAGFPVKKEIYTVDGANRILEMTITLNGIKTDGDEKLLTIPAGFKQVDLELMKKTLSGTPKTN